MVDLQSASCCLNTFCIYLQFFFSCYLLPVTFKYAYNQIFCHFRGNLLLHNPQHWFASLYGCALVRKMTSMWTLNTRFQNVNQSVGRSSRHTLQHRFLSVWVCLSVCLCLCLSFSVGPYVCPCALSVCLSLFYRMHSCTYLFVYLCQCALSLFHSLSLCYQIFSQLS